MPNVSQFPLLPANFFACIANISSEIPKFSAIQANVPPNAEKHMAKEKDADEDGDGNEEIATHLGGGEPLVGHFTSNDGSSSPESDDASDDA